MTAYLLKKSKTSSKVERTDVELTSPTWAGLFTTSDNEKNENNLQLCSEIINAIQEKQSSNIYELPSAEKKPHLSKTKRKLLEVRTPIYQRNFSIFTIMENFTG